MAERILILKGSDGEKRIRIDPDQLDPVQEPEEAVAV